MAAYVIVDIEITDRDKYSDYIKVAPESIAKFGGTYLVRGGRAERLEGAWEPKRVVVLKFDSFDRAREWWMSKEYDGPKALRQAASVTNMILVEGA